MSLLDYTVSEDDSPVYIRPTHLRRHSNQPFSFEPPPRLDRVNLEREDYTIKIERLTAKNRLRTARRVKDNIVIGLVLEGVPVIALVWAVIGGVWFVSAISSESANYLFPASYMTISSTIMYLLSMNVKKRFRRLHRKSLGRTGLARASQ